MKSQTDKIHYFLLSIPLTEGTWDAGTKSSSARDTDFVLKLLLPSVPDPKTENNSPCLEALLISAT